MPQCKHTAACRRLDDVVPEWQVFRMLDTLHNTSTGLDKIPAWFLWLGAPVFYKPFALLFNKSISTSVVPRQWRVLPSDQCPRILRQFNTLTFGQSRSRQSSVELCSALWLGRFCIQQFPCHQQLSITLAINLHFVQRAKLLQLSLLCCDPVAAGYESSGVDLS